MTQAVIITHTIDTSKLTGPPERAGHLMPVWLDEVQPLITEYLEARFDTEGTWMGGTAWAPHAPATVELRKRPGHGRGGIGRDVGTMWASFVKSAGAMAAPGGVLHMTDTTYERGSSLPQALWFHRGYKSTHAPARLEDGTWVFRRRRVPKQIVGRPIIQDPLPRTIVTLVEEAVARYVRGPVS